MLEISDFDRSDSRIQIKSYNQLNKVKSSRDVKFSQQIENIADINLNFKENIHKTSLTSTNNEVIEETKSISNIDSSEFDNFF